VWWPAWSLTHPRSARIVKTKVNARILPAFGDLPLNQVDTEQIGRWTHTLAADGLSPSSIRSCRALLGLILNAAVTDAYLPTPPPCRRRRSADLPAPVRSGSPGSSLTSSPMPSNPDTNQHSFAGVWHRALQTAGLDQAWPDHGGLRVGDLRHTHAVWLLA
jgi:hypothetical protein